MKKISQSLFVFLVILIQGCNRNNEIIDKLNRIKEVGDINPKEALTMMDSISADVRKESEYVQMKYDLLNVRLHDKANDSPTSDITIKHLLDYFEKNGSELDKQETFYYAGSVYRDLNDAPRALEHFHNALVCAKNLGNRCDSLILRNTYSNISHIHLKTLDYNSALRYAKLEYELSENLNQTGISDLIHLGISYLHTDSISEAKKWYDKAYNSMSNDRTNKDYTETLYYLLYAYSYIGDREMAEKCYDLVKEEADPNPIKIKNLNLGAYYVFINENDSAIKYFEKEALKKSDFLSMSDASKELFYIYKKRGDNMKAIKYADIFIRANDTLDFGKRQEIMASINNQYQYHLDKNAEIKMVEKSKRQRLLIVTLISVIILIVLLSVVVIVIRKNRYLRNLVKLTKERDAIKAEQKTLMEEIDKKSRELRLMREEREQTTKETEEVKAELLAVQSELKRKIQEVELNKQKLSENLERNNLFIRLIQQTEFEGKARDVIALVRQAAAGKKEMKSAEWRELYKAVDEIYPDFKDKIVNELKNFTEQQMQVCYLIRIGMSKPEIQNLTGLSRVTVWRWVKKYSWVLT